MPDKDFCDFLLLMAAVRRATRYRFTVGLLKIAASDALAAKTGPVPTHERLGPDDGWHRQDRWKPAIQMDKEPAMVRDPEASVARPSTDEAPRSQLQAATSTSITSSTRTRFSVHLNSTASITASSITLTHWSRRLASRPLHDKHRTMRTKSPLRPL
jgi:hypothetical protein